MKPLLLSTLAVLLSSGASAQLVISDDFDITSNDSLATGFGSDGVNTEIATRLSGQAAVDQSLSFIQTQAGKDASAYSISGNKLSIADQTGIGAFEFSANNVDAYDFAPYLVGKTYEILITLDNDSVDTVNRRFSFTLGTAQGQGVNLSPLSIQLQADANQAGAQIFKRVIAESNPAGIVINQSIATVNYGEPITLKLAISDVDTTFGHNSSYEIFLNGGATPIDSGSFGISSTARHLIFDVAPDCGPVTFDDFSVTVTGDAPAPPATPDRYVYFVDTAGQIRGFTGIGRGEIPITGATNYASGFLEATHVNYGTYQAFAHDPTSDIVYGINQFGDVVRWPTLTDWLANTNAIAPMIGDPGFEAYGADLAQGSVHGASYDPNTGGFYVVYEGSDPDIDGDIGQYANADDFLNNANASISTSVFGGNILNFYYSGEDAPTNQPAPFDLPGGNYVQATGGGQLEVFATLADYIGGGGNRTYQQSGFCVGCVAAFALPIPAEIPIDLKIISAQKDGSGEVVSATLDWTIQDGSSYTIKGSQDLLSGFSTISGFDNVTTTPIVVPVPSGYENRGFFTVEENP